SCRSGEEEAKAGRCRHADAEGRDEASLRDEMTQEGAPSDQSSCPVERGLDGEAVKRESRTRARIDARKAHEIEPAIPMIAPSRVMEQRETREGSEAQGFRPSRQERRRAYWEQRVRAEGAHRRPAGNFVAEKED